MVEGVYEKGSRFLQSQFGTERLAERLAKLTIHDTFNEEDRKFIARMDMFFLATVDQNGRANCSYKGGLPGFVRVTGENELAFPSYDGNGMYLSAGNIVDVKEVGLLFIDFERQLRLRINGRANINLKDGLSNEYPEAQFIVRVEARQIFSNCPRYIHQMKLVQRSQFVPTDQRKAPAPSWKKMDIISDTLPENDIARDPSREVADI